MSVSEVTFPPFDELVALAKHHPEQFTQLRQQCAEALIQSCTQNNQTRLRALQSNIELTIKQGKNPNHVNVLLMNKLHQQHILLLEYLKGQYSAQMQCADILPFK